MTATATVLPTYQITVPARAVALGWLNAFLASSKDADRPALYQTLSLECFPYGIQMIGCDGHALFRTWAPIRGEDETPSWPDASQVPDRTIVVMDPEGFGIGYMRTLLRVTGDEARANDDLILSMLPMDEEGTLALGSEFLSGRVALRACGQRIDLRLYEGEYPDWRKLNLGILPIERLETLTVQTRLLGLVGKLKAVSRVDLEFHGAEKHIAFTARGETELRGMIMPMRRGA